MAQTTPQAIRIGEDVEHRRHAVALAGLVRGEVRFGRHDRLLYATDASMYQVEPIGVVIPAGLDDVRATVRYCREHGLPVLPRGGGTSLAGQCVARAVVIDCSPRLTGVLEVDPARRRCVVEPGVSIEDLNEHLRAAGTGLHFAPDPSTARQCNIGGAIGNNAAGTRSIVYGRTSENLEGVRVLLSGGEECELSEGSCQRDPVARRLGEGVVDICLRHEALIRERFPKTIRRNAGYALDMMLAGIDRARRDGADPLSRLNLSHLICGSEGTLAVVTEATLRLHPVPVARGLAVLGFGTLDGAVEAVSPILSLGPSAVELLDDLVLGLARENIECRRYVELMPPPAGGRPLAAVLYVEFSSGSGAGEVRERFAALRTLAAERCPGAGFAAYEDEPSVQMALRLRKAGEPLLHSIPGRRKPLGFVEDNAVPVENLPEFVRRFREIIESHGTRAAFWAHASVGVLHVRPLLSLRDESDRRRMEDIAVKAADLARSLGGVMSGEHGDGRVRGPLLERHFGPELMAAFREVKRLFDPANLLNPGNIVEPGPIESIHESTRVRPAGADLSAPGIETFFDFSAEHGYDHAVELCNGSGVCRKKQGGTMCPSYMGTLDERHSTRGRGNALRLAITGQTGGVPGRPSWGDEETLRTLDLCLSCKACKSECPSNVDIAKYKAEYLAQSYRAAGRTPLKALAFGHVRALNRIGSALAPLSNAAANWRLTRFVTDRLLGLAPQRRLPRWERSLFRSAGPLLRVEDPAAPVLVLYADCFTAFNEPGIGLATIRLLRAFGYRVVMPRAACCGRAQISTGLLGAARRSASGASRRLAEEMARHDARALLVCEPSCLSAVKDDWRTLRLDDGGAAHRLAASAFLVEDFLDRAWEDHPQRPAFRAPEGRVLLHAHCHQKALWGAQSSARLLRRIAGARLEAPDTGCCGMAGSFGYTADRYGLSMKIGELALFPLARAMQPGDVLLAPGTSCRHQAHDGAGARALHPAEWLASMLA